MKLTASIDKNQLEIFKQHWDEGRSYQVTLNTYRQKSDDSEVEIEITLHDEPEHYDLGLEEQEKC